MSTLQEHVSRVKAAALADAARGWRVLLVHGIHAGRCTCGRSGCEKPGKHPRLARWLELATTDVPTITRAWSLYWHTSNVGVATGRGLLVLDVDPRHGGDASLADLERLHGLLPDTPRGLTGGGGTHYLFKVDAPVHNKVHIAPGLDIRGDGGFIVAPPSLHASGRRYAWDLAAHPDETPLALVPPWLLALCAQSTARPVTPAGGELRLVKGERNDGLFRLACGWRRKGLGAAAIGEMLRAVNMHHAAPPLPANELRMIADSVVTHYAPGSTDADAADDMLLAQLFGATTS